MEALLLGDDSSSGESDNEAVDSNAAPKAPGGAAGTTQTQAQPQPAGAAKPPSAPPAATTAGGGGAPSGTDRAAMLRNLYKSSKAPVTAPTGVPVPAASHPPHVATQQGQQAAQPQRQQMQHQQPQQHARPPFQGQSGAPQQQRQTSQPMQQQQHRRQQQMQQQQQQHHRQQPPPQQQRQQHQQKPEDDMYAPTPLAQLTQNQPPRMQHPQQQHYRQQQQQQQPPPQQQPKQQAQYRQPSQAQQRQQMAPGIQATGRSTAGAGGSIGTNSVGTGASSSTGGMSDTALRERKKKEQFLMFTRVLIKYLEQKDKNLHTRAKAIIKDCAEKNKAQTPGYESVTESMKRRLRELVGETYWKKATEYLVHFLKQKKVEAVQRQQGQQQPQRPNLTPEQRAQYERQKQLQRQKQQQATQAAGRQQVPGQSQQQKRAAGSTAPTVDSIMQDIHKRHEQITNTLPGSQQKPVGGTATTATATSSAKTTKASGKGRSTGKSSGAAKETGKTADKEKGGKKPTRRKSGGSTASSTSKKTSAAASKAEPTSVAATPVVTATTRLPKATRRTSVPKEDPPPTKEYQELMDLVENCVEFDWPSILTLLGNKNDFNLSEEERALLYDVTTTASFPITTGTTDSRKIDDHRETWGCTNVLSARNAWARVRLPEKRRLEAEAERAAQSVGDGMLTLPSPVASVGEKTGSPSKGSSDKTTDQQSLPKRATWMNEETAEKDKTLELLSEATQVYLKGVLEKAVQCARQRQNLDGIRLWHQQYASLPMNSKKQPVSTGSKIVASNRPRLSLRLGCDVSRQIARAEGNAAMTCKRMEEALERRLDVSSQDREINDETLAEGTCMGEVSLRPLLKAGVEKADVHAKRSFAVYGGMYAKDPPFGRAPKRGKISIEAEDFLMGSRMMTGNNFHRASNASGFLFF